MPINKYSVANHLHSEGWKLISDSYKNLNAELEMMCPNGHVQHMSYGNWRKQPFCDLCMAGDSRKIERNVIPLKKENTKRILALDAATVITGYAFYDSDELVSYGTFKIDKNLDSEQRINEVKKWLISAIKNSQPDLVGIENVQLQNHNGFSNVEVYRLLCNLQGVLIDTLYEMQVPHNLCYSTQWRKYCGISDGGTRENLKKLAQDKVRLWYGQNCTQDEADAICIGKYFCHVSKQSASWGEKI